MCLTMPSSNIVCFESYSLVFHPGGLADVAGHLVYLGAPLGGPTHDSTAPVISCWEDRKCMGACGL